MDIGQNKPGECFIKYGSYYRIKKEVRKNNAVTFERKIVENKQMTVGQDMG